MKKSYNNVSPIHLRHSSKQSNINNSFFSFLNNVKNIKSFKGKVTIDSLDILLNHINDRYITENYVAGEYFKSNQYQECFTYRDKNTNEHVFSLLKFKTDLNASQFEHKIQLVIPNFSNEEDAFHCLFNIGYGLFESAHKITRLDISVLSKKISTDFYFSCTHFKWKNEVSEFKDIRRKRGNISNFRIEGKTLSYSCYTCDEKDSSSATNLNKSKLRESRSNLEMQIKSRKLASLGITHIQDLNKLLDGRKVYSLNFYDISKMKQIEKPTPYQISKFYHFQGLCLSIGFNSARYWFNKNRNFKRDFADQLLEPIKIQNGNLLEDEIEERSRKYLKRMILLLKIMSSEYQDKYRNIYLKITEVSNKALFESHSDELELH